MGEYFSSNSKATCDKKAIEGIEMKSGGTDNPERQAA